MIYAIPALIYSPMLVLKTCAVVNQGLEPLDPTAQPTELPNVLHAFSDIIYIPMDVLKTGI